VGILERPRPLIPRECPRSPIHGLYIPADNFPLKDLPEKADRVKDALRSDQSTADHSQDGPVSQNENFRERAFDPRDPREIGNIRLDHEEGVANPTGDDIRSALSRRRETIMREAPGAELVFLTCLTPGMGGTEIFGRFISPEALMLGNEVFESTEKSIVVHRAFTAKEIITYAIATNEFKGRFQTLVRCSRDTC
jgi:hypothetical protein